MAIQEHLVLPCLIDGVTQSKLTNVSVTVENNLQEVRTILEGLAGFSTGTKRLEVSGTWSIPIGGPQFDAATAVSDETVHEIQIPYGTKSIVSEGKFTTCGMSQATDSASELTATFVGQFNPPE